MLVNAFAALNRTTRFSSQQSRRIVVVGGVLSASAFCVPAITCYVIARLSVSQLWGNEAQYFHNTSRTTFGLHCVSHRAPLGNGRVCEKLGMENNAYNQSGVCTKYGACLEAHKLG